MINRPVNWIAVFLACCVLLAGGRVSAQTLATPSWNGMLNWYSQAFDVEASTDATLTSIAATTLGGYETVTVHGRPGTYVGADPGADPLAAGWTLIGTGTARSSNFASLIIPINVQIPAGQTYAIYTRTGPGRIVASAGPGAVGEVTAADSVLTIRDGQFVFGAGLASGDSRSFTGAISYSTIREVPTMSEWAMILLGLLLAGGAAVHLQRQRITARSRSGCA